MAHLIYCDDKSKKLEKIVKDDSKTMVIKVQRKSQQKLL